jgi:hypothetical protein
MNTNLKLKINLAKRKSKLFVFFVSLFMAQVIYTIANLKNTGIGWDTLLEIKTYNLLKDSDFRSLAEVYNTLPGTLEFYGNSMYWFSEQLQVIFYHSNNIGIIDQIYFYKIINYIVINVSVGIFCYTFLNKSKKDWFPIFATMMILQLPLVFGHSVMNQKDVPVSAGILLILSSFNFGENYNKNCENIYIRVSFLILGIFIAVGSRTTIIFVVGLFFTIYILTLKLYSKKHIFKETIIFVTGTTIGILFVASVNEIYRLNPLKYFIDSLVMSDFKDKYYILTNGIQVSSIEIPYWYIPTWVLIQIPIGVIIFAIIGILIVIFKVKPKLDSDLIYLLILLASVLILIPALNITIYDGIRHIIFIVPIAAIVILRIIDSGLSINKHTVEINVICVVTSLYLLATNLFWFPYNYAYLNLIGYLQGGTQSYEGDYWGTSGKEAASYINQNDFKALSFSPTNSSTEIFISKQADSKSTYSLDFSFRRSGKINYLDDCVVTKSIYRSNSHFAYISMCKQR